MWTSIAITGASSGLGAAIARAAARPGVVLHLAGRDATRLAAVARDCAAAEVRVTVLDVTDAAACAAWVAGMGRCDLMIANAGISAGSGGGVESAEQVRAIFATNVDGVLNVALPAIAAMRDQAPGPDGVRGRVAVTGSLASFVAAPGAASYCASKAAVQRWAEATDASERKFGVRLSSICPGYVRTPMTEKNAFPMPWLMTPDEAAKRTLAGLAAGRLRVVYPRRLYFLARMVGALPPGWRNAILGRAPAKGKAG
ncbi:SDR family NAD(P)-dependent oxidoreductase [Humitalea sp. 24SJ18S-53]|uniref:SDR family NAD(P)-dependent oxidoreductase n=1 Tax=Humitalea sp. 24SJ18S-53 TaxID=3422307 RepID=UPI003D665417